jgi:subtilisin family serine protease
VLGCAVLAFQVESASAAPKVRTAEVAHGHRAASGEALVRVRRGGPPNVAQLAADPLADIESDEPVGRSGWRLVRSRSRSADNLADVLRMRPDVEFAEPNFAVSLMGTPDDLSAPLWALQNTGQRLENGEYGIAGVDLDAAHAWDITSGSRRIVVATIDTGIMQTHRDLAANLWTAPRAFSVTVGGLTISCAAGTHGFNAITRTCDPADDNGHGTHVAGSIGAVGNNASGVVGINWATSIMALKFMDETGNGYISDAINAIEFALQVKQTFGSEADIRILNNSWSGGGFSQAFQDEIARAQAAGILFVASAGNEGVNHEATPVYPSDYSGGNVLSVTATDYRDQPGSFADFGASHVHVAAPGVLIYSTELSTSDPAGTYGTRSGTSMAAAYTSGVAALVLSHCDYSVGALRESLIRSAVPVASMATRTQSGRRINAAAAVRSCDSQTGSGDIVIHATDIETADRHGNWNLAAEPGAADGQALVTPDRGWSSTGEPLAQPTDYVDVRFAAQSGVPYRVWLRLKAGGDSKWNDSLWLQFSDAMVNGSSAYALNSTSAIAVNLENCSGCGTAGWGWQDGAYWLAHTPVSFTTSGTHTIRIQVREDGVAFDQIVISPSTWMSAPPGQVMSDSTILARTGASSAGSGSSTGTPPTPASAPYHSQPAALPGTVEAEDFDTGVDGIAYHDVDAPNNGSMYRSNTGVDLQAASGGGYNVGWVAAGEWLAYTVNIWTAGVYTAEFRVAAYGAGGSFHLEVDGTNVTGTLNVPNTGDWQNWVTVRRDVTLPSGVRVVRLVMDSATAGIVGNFDRFSIKAATSTTSGTAVPGRLLATSFDEGGEGVGYHDDSNGNSGGALRDGDVDIQACCDGGYNVGWISAGEWLRFTVNVAIAGSYRLQLRVASPDGGATVHVNAGVTNLTGEIAIPRTGDWQAWTTITVPVNLAAGTQALTIVFDNPGLNLHYIDVVAP